ncbi:MAG: DNA polymerase III subunit delta, partial [Flammeovirgaceae bacterium]|nr:DNA polymerase III subunit delta [Flammeovirgaceae bacterium]MDW8286872.1 DNA polymerase III subunit delta [Flammeovirgaceae bacterium]
MKFSEIIGLEETKQALIQAIHHEQVPHAQLFIGKEGSANLALALAYATYLNCTQRQNNDACGECSSCRKYEKLLHPDLHFIFPTNTTKKITKREDALSNGELLKEWRKFVLQNPYRNIVEWSLFIGTENKQCIIPKEESRNIIKALSLKAFEATYKVMLIWLPELMHEATANAILKILEEPSPRTVFLLVTNDAEKILVTILSRTQKVMVRSFEDGEIVAFLRAEGYDEAKAKEAAYLAQGNLQEALRLIQQTQDDQQSFFRDWMRECYKQDYFALFKRSEEFKSWSKEAQKGLMQYGLGILREAIVFKYEPRLNRLTDVK